MKILITFILLALIGGMIYSSAALATGAQEDLVAGIAALHSKNYKTAFAEFSKAATQGDATAQFNLGIMYDNGQGVTQDYLSAHMWYNIAGANGNKPAIKARDQMAGKMTAAQIATARKMAGAWLQKHQKP